MSSPTLFFFEIVFVWVPSASPYEFWDQPVGFWGAAAGTLVEAVLCADEWRLASVPMGSVSRSKGVGGFPFV